jgi:hypothetical protein
MNGKSRVFAWGSCHGSWTISWLSAYRSGRWQSSANASTPARNLSSKYPKMLYFLPKSKKNPLLMFTNHSTGRNRKILIT